MSVVYIFYTIPCFLASFFIGKVSKLLIVSDILPFRACRARGKEGRVLRSNGFGTLKGAQAVVCDLDGRNRCELDIEAPPA